jgi:hypothetical protein
MKLFAVSVVLGLVFAPLLGAAENLSVKAAPVYDPATVVDVSGVVTEVRNVPKGSPIEGINLTVKTKDETINIYVAPAEFVKLCDITFARNDEVRVIGSKVESEGEGLILSREIQMGQTTLIVRDKDGIPLWTYLLRKTPTAE